MTVGKSAGANLPDCIPSTTDEGVRVDAEQICFDSGPSPLWRTISYDANDGTLLDVRFYDTNGTEVTPTGAEIPCGSGAAANVNVIGPIGPGACASAVRVTQCEPVLLDDSTPIDVAVTAELLRGDGLNLLGVATWDITVDPTGSGVRSVTMMRRPGGAAGSVTITTTTGAMAFYVGESFTWDVSTGPLSVTNTAAANDVVITWTETP